jgi:hypothetical protein
MKKNILIAIIVFVAAFAVIVPVQSQNLPFSNNYQQISYNPGCCSRCDVLIGEGKLDYQSWYRCKQQCGCIGF